jgi:uncharacterized SAM-binding protein YcdF (DUF218 family)
MSFDSLIYPVSKIVAVLLQPSTLAVLAVAIGLFLGWWGRHPRAAARFSRGGLMLLLVGGILPLGNVLVLPLEQRFADVRLPAAGEPVAGILLLGGFEDGWVSAGRGQLTVNESAERLTEGVRLAHLWPSAKVIFTGGVGALWHSHENGTEPVRRYLADLGIAPERLVLEGRSRNTHENGLYTAELVRPKPGERWILVTSAYHMPRSVGVFRKLGFEVIAYPVDFRTRGPEDATRLFDSIAAGFQRLDLAVKEWMGLVYYRLLGRTGELLPRP